MAKSKKVAIATLNKYCSFRDEPGNQPTCNHPASSAVVGPNDNLYWRCMSHQGMYTPGVAGSTRFQVEVKDDQ